MIVFARIASLRESVNSLVDIRVSSVLIQIVHRYCL